MNGEMEEMAACIREALMLRLPEGMRIEYAAADDWLYQLRRDGAWLVSGDVWGYSGEGRIRTRFCACLRRTKVSYRVLRVDTVSAAER